MVLAVVVPENDETNIINMPFNREKDGEDDFFDSSIHDLDHAPPPPEPSYSGGSPVALDGSSSSVMLNNLQQSPRTRARSKSVSFGGAVNDSASAVTFHSTNRQRGWSLSGTAPPASASAPHALFGETTSHLFAPSLHERKQRRPSLNEGQEITSHTVSFERVARQSLVDQGMLRIPSYEDQEDADNLRSGSLQHGHQLQHERDEGEHLPRRRRSGSKDLSAGGVHSTESDLEDSNYDDDDDETLDEESMSSMTPSRTPIIFLGFKLPRWVSNRPSWNRVAEFVVTRAPCFWCIRFRQNTDRAILARLNVLCMFFAIFQSISAIWLSTAFTRHKVLLTNEALPGTRPPSTLGVLVNVWNINGNVFGLGFLAFVLILTSLLTWRVVRNVNLLGAIRYMWVLLWVLPLEIYFTIGLFDYFRVTDVWITHWWRDSTLTVFREAFCDPSSSAQTLCTVPLSNATTELEWCMSEYNATDCTRIRDRAQSDMDSFMLGYYYVNAAWGLCMILLLLLIVVTLENIVTRPLVQKSRESNIPAWLSLPTLGCLCVGTLFGFSRSSGLNTQSRSGVSFIGPLYISCGGLFLIDAALGWYISASKILNSRDKRRKMIGIMTFILIMGAILVLLGTIFAFSIAFSVSLVDIPLNEELRGALACFLDRAGSCTACDPADGSQIRCPEWTDKDVTKVLQTQAKSSATLSAICLLYALSAIRFGFNFRKHIRMYQIDYV